MDTDSRGDASGNAPLNYIDQRAHKIIGVLIAWGVVQDDIFHLPKHYALYRDYAVLCLNKGLLTGAADVHNVWAAWELEYGNPEHRSIVPFEELSQTVQDLDLPFVRAIHEVASEDIPYAELVAMTTDHERGGTYYPGGDL